MAALDYLHRAGLTVEAVAGKLRASPVERITPELRRFIVEHKVELLIELSAANDPQSAAEAPPAPAAEAASEPRCNAWTVTRNGSPICRMVGQPMTRTEALATARWRWPDADILET